MASPEPATRAVKQVSGVVSGNPRGRHPAPVAFGTLNQVVKYRTLDGTFGALSHPTRRQIVLRLREGEATVSELAAPHNVSLPAISKHVRVLEEAGLLFRRREGREYHCSLATSPLQEVESWLGRFRGPSRVTAGKRKENQHG